MSRPREWWPVCETDPVPGDTETLAALGGHMRDAAAEIERIATLLPQVCSSDAWDSDAGEQFRAKAGTTASGVAKTHRRFFTVAQALGRSTYGGTGYAAQLAEHQNTADTALQAVTGSPGSVGSEVERRNYWNLLLAATSGADPAQPPAKKGTRGPAAGAMPQASPGVIPPDLPTFAAGDAEVARLKTSYNATLATLAASTRTITRAATQNTADAQAAAQAIRTVIDNDGLKNPSGFMHWLRHTADDIGGYVSAHWVGFLKTLANIAGILATICGILAMIFAFIPGLEEFAALFETLALLAQFVSFLCHVVLMATGHGSLFDVALDAIGLVTFGVGKGLIGGAEATAKVAEEASTVYRAVADVGGVGKIIEAGDKAAEAATGLDRISMVSKMMEGLKKAISVRPVLKSAAQAWQDGKFGAAMGEHAAATLLGGFKSAIGMGSPEIASALSKSVAAGSAMTYASGTAWGITSRVQIAQNLFRLTQTTGVGTDLTSKLDSILHLAGLNLPGWDNIPSWPAKAG
jgi:hypothetical protein